MAGLNLGSRFRVHIPRLLDVDSNVSPCFFCNSYHVVDLGQRARPTLEGLHPHTPFLICWTPSTTTEVSHLPCTDNPQRKEKKMATANLPPGPALEAISDEIDAHNSEKYSSPSTFRLYPPTPTSPLLQFYTLQHTHQTYAYNLSARSRFHSPTRPRPRHTIWSALLLLSSLVDASDPDATALSQLQHSLQTGEALRRDGHPRWMQLVGLIHDLGKLMAFVGGGVTQGGQWDVVGDTFPVGCKFREEVLVYPGTWGGNADVGDEVYRTRLGVYEDGCGMGGLVMSWGHDEFLYQVLKGLRGRCRLPEVGLGVVRFHSFYGWHREGGYREFMAEGDEEVLEAVKVFNKYDLYTKRDQEVDVEGVRGYWEGLIAEFIEGDGVIEW